MRRIDIIKRAGRNLRQSKGRTILTALAISVGAFTIGLAMMAGEGGRLYTNNIVDSAGDKKVITVYKKAVSSSAEEEALPEYSDSKDKNKSSEVKDRSSLRSKYSMGDEDLTKLRSIPHVEKVTPSYSTSGIVYVKSSGNGKKFTPDIAVKADRTRAELAAGSLDDFILKSGEAIIPESYVGKMGFASAKSAIRGGSSWSASASKEISLKIVAVDKQSDTTIFYQPAVRISSDDAKDIYEYSHYKGLSNEYSLVIVSVDDVKNVDAVKDEISKSYTASSIQDARKALLTMVNVAQMALIGFGGLALLASVFGIINTMYISVLERTSQIGLMKALGTSGRDIGRLFRYEAAWVGLLGGLIGVGFASLITLFNPVIASALKLGAGTNLLVINPIQIILLIVSLMVMAVLAGWLPSRKATKLDPIEALRTE